MNPAIIISIISIFISTLTFNFYILRWIYQNPKIKKILWVYTCPHQANKAFYDYLCEARTKCDHFIETSIDTIENKGFENKYFETRMPIKKIDVYSPVKYKNNVTILVEHISCGFRFWFVQIDGIPKRVSKDIPQLFEKNEYSSKKTT